eukprot:155969-Pyramimonas_sp.AAC.1
MLDPLTLRADTDYIGCKRRRESTNCGIAQWGNQLIKSWSYTQSVVAVSSGQAEEYGAVKGASVAMTLQSLLSDLGITCVIDVKVTQVPQWE